MGESSPRSARAGLRCNSRCCSLGLLDCSVRLRVADLSRRGGLHSWLHVALPQLQSFCEAVHTRLLHLARSLGLAWLLRQPNNSPLA